MEHVFKTRPPGFGMGLFIGVVTAICITVVLVDRTLWFCPLSLAPSILIYADKATSRYILKQNGTLSIKKKFSSDQTIERILKVTYNPQAWSMQKIKIDFPGGFVAIDPETPLRFIEQIRQTVPDAEIVIRE